MSKTSSASSGRMRRAVDRSIKAAHEQGLIDLDLQAGPICALRILAEQLDTPGWPLIDGRLDNVSLPTILRYCQALGIVLNIDGKRANAVKSPKVDVAPRNDFEAFLSRHHG